MTQTYDIDRIVREVLAELARAPAAPPSIPASPAPIQVKTPTPSVPAIQPNRHELVVPSRLVTMSEVAGRLAGVRRLMVRPGTVITPAVKEELQKRSIQVNFCEAAAAPAGSLRLVMIAARTRIDLQPLAAALQSSGIAVETHSLKCLLAATDQLAGELKQPHTLGALLTPYEAETMCLANRLPGIRAAAGRSAGQVAADAAAVGANVLVVNPKKIGSFEIGQILGEFCRGGVRACPDVLKAKLG